MVKGTWHVCANTEPSGPLRCGFLASLVRPESKGEQSLWTHFHRLSAPGAGFWHCPGGSPFSKLKDTLCADTVPCFELDHPPPLPSSRHSNPSVENPKDSVLPVAVLAKGFLLGSEIFFKPGGWERIVAWMRSPVIRQVPRCSERGGEVSQPASLPSGCFLWARGIELALFP